MGAALQGTHVDLLSIIAIAGGIQGILLAFASFSKKYSKPSFLLSSFLLLISLKVLYLVLVHTKYIYQIPHLVAVTDPFVFIYIPLFYFYVLSIIQPDFRLKWWLSLHAIPLIWYVHKISGLYLAPAEYKIRHLDYFYQNIESTNDRGLNLMILAYAGAYIAMAIWKYVQFYKQNAIYSNGRFSKNQYGVRLILGSFILVYFVNVFRILFAYETAYILTEGVLSAIILYIIGYLSLAKPNFLYGLQKVPSAPLEQKITRELVSKIENHMDREKPYLDHQLTLSKLADSIGISPQKLSQLLNDHFRTNFFNYVNLYRIEAAKKLLLDFNQQLYSLEKIYREVGFRSKSSFYSAFKKFTKMTPIQYKKGHS